MYPQELGVVVFTGGLGYILGYLQQKNMKDTTRKNLPLLYSIIGIIIGGIVNNYLISLV